MKKKRLFILTLLTSLAFSQAVSASEVTISATDMIDVQMVSEETSLILDQDSITLTETSNSRYIGVTDSSITENTSFTFTSSNPEIVEVKAHAEDDIKVIAKNYGSATITVKSADESKTANCVVQVKMSESAISFDDMTLVIGTDSQITPKFAIEGFVYPTNKIFFTSNDESIVKAEGSKLTPVKAGETTVKAIVDASNNFDTRIEKTFKVKVNSPVTSIEVAKDSYDLFIGDSVQLSPVVLPENATDKTITYLSDDDTVAKVDARGKITAVSSGKCKITVKALDGSNTKKEILISVTQPVKEIKVERAEFTLYQDQGFFLAPPTILPESATNKEYDITSSDESVITVTKDRKVTTVAPGKATITISAKDGSKVKTNISVTVLGQITALTSGTKDVSVEAESDATILFNTTVSGNDIYTDLLTASAKDNTVVGSIAISKNEDEKNNTKLTFKGLKQGETEIVVSSKNPTFANVSLTFKVNVTEKKVETDSSQDTDKISSVTGLDNVSYSIKGNTAVVSNTAGAKGKITILPSVKIGNKEYKVTEISDKAFKGNTKITSVSIPASITVIGKQAFSGCTKITSVTIGKNVTTISDDAFKGCKSIKKITIPSKVTKIGKNAFNGCSKLKIVTIKSNKLKTVGSKAFSNIANKSSIVVPKSKKAKYKKLLNKKYSVKKTIVK